MIAKKVKITPPTQPINWPREEKNTGVNATSSQKKVEDQEGYHEANRGD